MFKDIIKRRGRGIKAELLSVLSPVKQSVTYSRLKRGALTALDFQQRTSISASMVPNPRDHMGHTEAKVLTPVILEQGTIIQFFYIYFLSISVSQNKRE